MNEEDFISALRETLAGWRFQPLTIPGRLDIDPDYIIEIAMTPASIESFISDFMTRLKESAGVFRL